MQKATDFYKLYFADVKISMVCEPNFNSEIGDRLFPKC